MQVCLQWMRRLAVSVFFSGMFLFGMLSPKCRCGGITKCNAREFHLYSQSGRYLVQNCSRIRCDRAAACRLNDIAQPRLIRLGQKIVIPTASAVVADSSQSGTQYTVVSGMRL